MGERPKRVTAEWPDVARDAAPSPMGQQVPSGGSFGPEVARRAESRPSAPKRSKRGRLGWFPTPVRRIAKILIFLLVFEYLVIPQINGTRRTIDLLGRVNFWYLLAGIGLEAAAIVAYAQLTRAVLPRHKSPSLFTLLRIQLSTVAVSHVVPG